jgi:hypothetical protein
MSRFDNELIKQAENAFQERGLSGTTTTPRQQPYDQIDSLGSGGWPEQAPDPVEEVADWVANMPMVRQLDVRDLDAADEGEIIGGPGSSAIYAEGQPMYASVNPIDESLYQVYKASREIRDAIRDEVDFDFSDLFTASNEASTVLRFASANGEVKQVIGTVASIVADIENDLIVTSDYRQASADLKALEGLLEDIKVAATGEDDGEGNEDDGDSDDSLGTQAKKKSCKNCKGKGCDKCKKSSKDSDDDDDDDDDDCKNCKGKGCFMCKGKNKKKSARKEWCKGPGCEVADCDGKKEPKKSSNGNQESLQVVDVRDLDDQAGVWDRQRVMTPDHTTNVLVPEEVNGEDAGYVPYYNDGSETGIVPQQGPHEREVWPMDGTNPAFAPYAGTVAAVQASREKIFAAIQVVDRLEKLGMVTHDDRAKHIAKFEQMSDSKLAGFVASIDMLEESGARQPRSQKVAKGNNSLPEMGRLTTASSATRQDIISDDWLMTL